MADTINILTAADRLDNDLSDKDADFLLTARQGVALGDVDADIFRDLYDKGYLEVVNFSHPRASTAIKGVILSEDGVKIVNVIDNRVWGRPEVTNTEPTYPARRENVEKLIKTDDEQFMKDVALGGDDLRKTDKKLVEANGETGEAGKADKAKK